MSVSFKKIFGLKKSESQASVLTETKIVEQTAAGDVKDTAVKAEADANSKHGDNGVCCGSCS